MQYHIKDVRLASSGKKRIEWARLRMPVLESISRKESLGKPLKGVKIAACLHVTTETAALAIALKKSGALVRVCASNPLSTQDDVSASLVKNFGIEVFAIKGENRSTYYSHIKKVLQFGPHITLDDGADLVATIHKSRKGVRLPWGGTEETTTGVIRLRSLEKEKRLLYPIIAVNDAQTKYMFDNRYGTGQSTLDGILRATNFLLAGTDFVVCGYGWCGRGVAMRARGAGANVYVCETDPLRALEAKMDGYNVVPLKAASKSADIIVTVTGNTAILRKEHFLLMKDKVLIANSGHFNVEINIPQLEKMAVKKSQVKPMVTEYSLRGGKRIYLLGEGRLVNLACAEGHPAQVMDLSFTNQFLSAIYIKKNHGRMQKKVYRVPEDIDKKAALLKLRTMGIKIDKLTPEQKKYLGSWSLGT